MPPTTPHLAFVGLAGVGKSAIARRIGSHLRRPVYDLDATVSQRAGRTIPEIFATDGEPAFRSMETDALRAALASPTPSVIATGGGIVEAEENRELLAGARVVLLHTTDAVLCDRLRNSSNRRPLLEGDLEANLAALRERRDPLYHQVADVEVEVGFHDVAGTAAVVARRIEAAWPDLVSEAPTDTAVDASQQRATEVPR